MTLPIRLSAAAQRTHPSSISHLMQTALENPGIVSLAAGFVDQQSLPVEIAAQAADAVLGDSVEGRRALQYGTTIGDLGAASSPARTPGTERRPARRLLQGGIPERSSRPARPS